MLEKMKIYDSSFKTDFISFNKKKERNLKLKKIPVKFC